MCNMHEITPGVHYIHKEDHRNRSPIKSQWTVSEEEERRIFSRAYSQNWCDGVTGWGVRVIGDVIGALGMGVDRARDLFIAKFVDGNANQRWHGYPADHVANQHDVPDERVLRRWHEIGYLNLAKARKIVKRQPCDI